MKKYLFLAVAALAASVACTRVEIDENAAPDQKIGFEVANYAAQTRGNVALTNAEDGIYQFHTYAYQFPTIGNPREFMNVDILPWSTDSTPVQVTAANDGDKTIGSWAPAEDYFWPKTGWINFYSYAGSPAPTSLVANTSEDWKTVTLTYDDAVITFTSNILVADAALHYARANSADSHYDVDENETSSNHVTKGVPTLFRHQLAKVKFDVRARTTLDKVSANTTWKVQVLATQSYGTTPTTIKSAITPKNTGDLVLTNVDDKSAADTKVWTKVTEGAVSGWVPGSATEEIVFTATADIASAPAVLTIPTGAIESTTGETPAPYDPVVLVAERSVMPQLTANVPFTLVYKVQALHGSTVFMEEIRTVGVPAIDGGTAKSLADLVSTLSSWQANKRIVYHIIIDPVSEKVTFDPAVEEYDPVDEYNGYINETGIVSSL